MAYEPSYCYGALAVHLGRHDARDVMDYYTERYAFDKRPRPVHNAAYFIDCEARFMFERMQETRVELGLPLMRDEWAEADAAHMARVIAEDEAMEKRLGRKRIERLEVAWELHREENGFRVHV